MASVGETPIFFFFELRRKIWISVPTRSPYRVDQLCFLPRRVLTAGKFEILRRTTGLFLFFPVSRTAQIFFFPITFSLLLTLPTRLLDFLQMRGSFLSLYYSSCHVSHFPWSMCHMDTCSRWNSSHHMALMPCVLLPWFHVVASGHAMWHHPMCHPTPGVSKNVKFRQSRNSTKFD